jgi:hypothetical protein
MKRHNEEKKGLEWDAVHLFIDLYNANHETKYRLLYLQEKPDAVLEDRQRKKQGMEITHLFYNSAEAKRVLGRPEEVPSGFMILDHLIFELNELIKTKEHKKSNYSQDYPISLLIRNASPIYGMSDILGIKHKIYKPNEVFQDIWFLSRDGTDDWLLYNLDQLNKLKDIARTKS